MISLSFGLVVSLVLTVVAILAAGAWSGRRVETAEEFSLSGRSAGLALGVGTLFANDFGRAHFRLDERYMLLITHVAVVAFAGLAVTIALANLDSFLLDWNYL